ncbi:hypothetical protein V8E36_007640 [Tilletia maclaganii]
MSQVSTTTSTYMLTKHQGASPTLSWTFFNRPHLIVKIYRTTTTPGPRSKALAKLCGPYFRQQSASSMRLEVEWQAKNASSSQTQRGESPSTVTCLQTLNFDAQARMLANALPRSELPVKATFQDNIIGFRFLDTSLPAMSLYRRFQLQFPNRADMLRFLGEIENVCPCAETTIAPVPPTTLTTSAKDKSTGGPVQGPTTEKPAPIATSAPIPSTIVAPIQAQLPASAPVSAGNVAPVRPPDSEAGTLDSHSLQAVANAEQTLDDMPGAISGSTEPKLHETAAVSSTKAPTRAEPESGPSSTSGPDWSPLRVLRFFPRPTSSFIDHSSWTWTVQYAIELKYDGRRVQVHFQRRNRYGVKDLRIYGKDGTPIFMYASESRSFAEQALLEAFPAVNEIAVDAEFIRLAMNEDGQGTILRRNQDLPIGHSGQWGLVLFDILWLDGTKLSGKPYRERRAHLERLAATSTHARLAEQLTLPANGFGELMSDLQAQGSEGVVVKRWDDKYCPGTTWLKERVGNFFGFEDGYESP